MALVQFAFSSRATRGLPPAARLRIAREAWLFNVRSELTGELRCERGRFRQVIEGPCDVVLALASRILTDPRHEDIAVSAFGAIPERRFASWAAIGFDAPGLAVSCGPEVHALRELRLPAAAAQRAPVPAHLRMG
jgi:Sensors of blue-light using FAD